MTFAEGCDFCRIARGIGKSTEVIAEGASWIAIFPLSPATPGHTLIIPRAHVTDFWSAPEALTLQLNEAAHRVGRAIIDGLAPEGMNLISSAGDVADQTVFHLHIHLVPRWKNDCFGAIWPPQGKYEDASLGDVAARIRAACADLGQAGSSVT